MIGSNRKRRIDGNLCDLRRQTRQEGGPSMSVASCEIKLCECGCGRPAPIAKWNKPKRGEIKGIPLRFIVGHNLGKGENSVSWKGGTHEIHKGEINGYIRTWARENPMADCDGYVLAHRLQAGKALGKILPDKSQVHHHNKSQLVICQDNAYHKFLHQRTRALRACGHANWRRCNFCKQWDDPENMTVCKQSRNVHHKLCVNNYQKQWDRMNKKRRENALIRNMSVA